MIWFLVTTDRRMVVRISSSWPPFWRFSNSISTAVRVVRLFLGLHEFNPSFAEDLASGLLEVSQALLVKLFHSLPVVEPYTCLSPGLDASVGLKTLGTFPFAISIA